MVFICLNSFYWLYLVYSQILKLMMLFLFINQELIGETTNFHQIAVNPKPGKHTLTLVDETGNRLVQIFTVLDQNKKKK
jgi:hypothetical protein